MLYKNYHKLNEVLCNFIQVIREEIDHFDL